MHETSWALTRLHSRFHFSLSSSISSSLLPAALPSRWSLFPCSPPAIPPSEWVNALNARGIHEINIVGDSHQRFLKVHLVYLLTGVVTSTGKYCFDVVDIPLGTQSKPRLRINFVWIDGIYLNNEFGCM